MVVRNLKKLTEKNGTDRNGTEKNETEQNRTAISPHWLLPLTVHYISNAWRNRCEEIDRTEVLVLPGTHLSLHCNLMGWTTNKQTSTQTDRQTDRKNQQT